MDRCVIQRRLAETEEQIANGEKQIGAATQAHRRTGLEEKALSSHAKYSGDSWVGSAANRSVG